MIFNFPSRLLPRLVQLLRLADWPGLPATRFRRPGGSGWRQRGKATAPPNRYETLIRKISDGIHLVDAAGHIVELSDSFCTMLGYTRDEMIGMHISAWEARYSETEIMAMLPRLLADDTELRVFETVHRRKDGSTIPVELNNRAVTLDGQRFILNSARDISNRLRVRQALQDSENRYRQFFENNVSIKLVVDMADGNIVDANSSAARFYGYPKRRLLAMRIDDIECLTAEQLEREQALAHAEQRDYIQSRHRLASGDIRDVEIYSGRTELHGRTLRFCIVHDVTERRRIETQLQLAASVFENSYEGILVTTPDNRVININPAFSRITGYSLDEIIGQNPRILSSELQDSEFYALMWKAVAEHGFWRGEIWNRRKNGEVYAEMLSISTIRNADGAVQYYVGVFSDISAYKKLEAELEHIAHYDPLTGVPNRRLLADRMHQAISRSQRYQQPLAVCYLDLDGFKPVNDRYGHNAGDRLLIEITHRLDTLLRANDTIARLGGDEFVLLLSDLAHAEEIHIIMERVLDAVNQPMIIDGNTVSVSASIGVSLSPPDEADADILLRHADQAMYRAKECCKNSYHLHDPEQDRQIRRHHDKLRRITQALEQNELALFYQPKTDIISREIIGMEALIRWHHPELGLLLPAAFLNDIHGTRLEITISQWVIEQALRQMSAWQHQGHQISVSINIGATHLLHADFMQHIVQALARYPEVAPAQLELEILETTALSDLQQASHVLDNCSALGVRFALDDFGTGYSSLAYFRRLKVDTIKIDRSFVLNMLDSTNALDIVENVVRLAHGFNRMVVAEGIETIEHGALLVLTGCRICQGFGIAHPMPADEVVGWSRQWNAPATGDAMPPGLRPQDIPLILAAQSHRKWVNRLIEQLINPDLDDATELNDTDCAFGRWYRSEGLSRYANLDEFRDIGPLHQHIHRLARELVPLSRAGHARLVQERIPEIQQVHTQLLICFAALVKRLSPVRPALLPPRPQ